MACSRVKLLLACICQAVYMLVPPVRGLSSHGSDGSGFDSGDCRGSCMMIIKMGTELPTRCYHVQASESLEGFPHNTPAQACEAPKLLFMETQTVSHPSLEASSDAAEPDLFTIEAAEHWNHHCWISRWIKAAVKAKQSNVDVLCCRASSTPNVCWNHENREGHIKAKASWKLLEMDWGCSTCFGSAPQACVGEGLMVTWAPVPGKDGLRASSPSSRSASKILELKTVTGNVLLSNSTKCCQHWRYFRFLWWC